MRDIPVAASLRVRVKTPSKPHRMNTLSSGSLPDVVAPPPAATPLISLPNAVRGTAEGGRGSCSEQLSSAWGRQRTSEVASPEPPPEVVALHPLAALAARLSAIGSPTLFGIHAHDMRHCLSAECTSAAHPHGAISGAQEQGVAAVWREARELAHALLRRVQRVPGVARKVVDVERHRSIENKTRRQEDSTLMDFVFVTQRPLLLPEPVDLI